MEKPRSLNLESVNVECLELEILSRMESSKAAQKLGDPLLEDLFTNSNIPLNEIKSTILTDGIIAPSANQGYTLLHAFAARGNEAAVKKLAKLGAPINKVNKDGCSPLYLAVMNGHKPTIDVLIELGCHVDGSDSPLNPLFLAAVRGHLEITKELVFAINKPDPIWKVPHMLQQTAVKGHSTVLKFLLENGAKDIHSAAEAISSPFYKGGTTRLPIVRTALHEALKLNFPVEVIRLLITSDNIKISDYDGVMAIHEAASGQMAASVKELLGAEADPNATNLQRNTPLHLAIENPSKDAIEIVRYLLEGGAKVGMTDSIGDPALYCAATKNPPDVAMMNLLLDHGATPDCLAKLNLSNDGLRERFGEGTGERLVELRRASTQKVQPHGSRQISLSKLTTRGRGTQRATTR